MKHKKILVWLILVVGGISGCGHSDEKTEAEEIVVAFNESDINAVNQNIFGNNELKVDDELLEIFDADEEKSGIMSKIIELDTISVKKVTDNEIIYQVEAPDMSRILEEISLDRLDSMTEEEFEQYISDYLHDADVIVSDAAVPYTKEKGEIYTDYRTAEFINAISGGLLEAYQELYQEMLNGYLTETEGE